MIYWVELRNGDLQIRERQPKNRAYATESTVEVDWQHYRHTFEFFKADGTKGESYVLDTHCGYDRGPKKLNVIRARMPRG